MMFDYRNWVEAIYLDWIDILIKKQGCYDRLVQYLYEIPFKYSNPMDSNRDEDGKALRYRFGYIKGVTNLAIDSYLNRDCSSILEMMVALSIRCENNIMSDPDIGDRTSTWFWGMIESLGLSDMTNERFDVEKVDSIIHRFINRSYFKNGRGGLFTIKDKTKDMRTAEIWYQMCWYLDEIIYG